MAVPLVDLHVHLRGTLSFAEVARYAIASRTDISALEDYDSPNHTWKNFEEFLRAYDVAGSVVKSADDLATVAQIYLAKCHAEGVGYVEFMASPLHFIDNGLSYASFVQAIAGAFETARNVSGIEARLIATALRHHGGSQAARLAKIVADHPNRNVVGFGLTGNEHEYDAREFGEAFRIAKCAGLGLTAHTGEWLGPASVIEMVEVLELDRIGHGTRLCEDDAALRSVAEGNVGIEVCLSSNVSLKAVDELRNHPIGKFLAEGCRVTVATDDPGFFATTPKNEFKLATEVCGLTTEQQLKIYQDSVDMAFCDSETKVALVEKIKSS